MTELYRRESGHFSKFVRIIHTQIINKVEIMEGIYSFCAARYRMTHGPVPVHGPRVGDRFYKELIDLSVRRARACTNSNAAADSLFQARKAAAHLIPRKVSRLKISVAPIQARVPSSRWLKWDAP